MDPLEEFMQGLLDQLLVDRGPIYYNDDGLELVKQAAADTWDAMDPVDQQRLIDESYKFVTSCHQ
jgi:hypothetical protein